MKKNAMGGKFFAYILTAVIMLTMQEVPVLAETMYPESQTEILETVHPEGQPKSSEQQEGQPEVSGQPENQPGSSDQPQAQPEASEQQNQPVVSAEQSNTETRTLSNDVLAECIVPGMNPQGVIVNLFDYWQEGGRDPEKEIPHDYTYWDDATGVWKEVEATTFNSGISRGHLLRFGYRANADCEYCADMILGDYGAWNQYYQSYGGQLVSGDTGKLYTGIVKNKLGADGFPVLNLSDKTDAEFGRYSDPGNVAEGYLAHKEESLAYLFSPNAANAYKEIHQNVQGLFQPGPNGSYYYNSTKNFASYDSRTNSFILYNSPGVAEADDSGKAEYCGQFFPFNKAVDVFDTYTTDAGGKYRLTYMGPADQGSDADNSGDKGGYAAVMDANGNGYIQCYAPRLNHYLGMTLEMKFLQPENGCLPDSNAPMTFEFSGDDDVWIFIDDVLVADLGGIHEAYSLKIDFSDGSVYIQKAGQADSKDHTLLDSFKIVYGEGTNPGSIEFHNETFADNTVHTLKMFYLERGHMASNLSLDFNIQTMSYVQVVNESDSELENTDDSMVPIPRTGDDSMIWWWAAICITSLLGIGAIMRSLKQKK